MFTMGSLSFSILFRRQAKIARKKSEIFSRWFQIDSRRPMTPVALLLIGFDRRDSRTDGAQGTSTLDLELFFSIMHTEHPEFCTKLLLHLWEFDRGDRRTDGTAGTGTLDLDLLYNQKKCKYSTKTGNLHKSFPVKLTEEKVRPLLGSGLQAGLISILKSF